MDKRTEQLILRTYKQLCKENPGVKIGAKRVLTAAGLHGKVGRTAALKLIDPDWYEGHKSYKRDRKNAPKPDPKPKAEVVRSEEAEKTPQDLLKLLLKRKEQGVSTAELAKYPEHALAQLEETGRQIDLRAGRIVLETNPAHRIREEVTDGIFDPRRAFHEFAVISDLHFANRWAQPWFVQQVGEEAARRKAPIFNCGDTFDGTPKMHRSYVFELGLHELDDQVDFGADVIREIPTEMWGIGGNHCGSWWTESGVDPLRLLEERTDNFHNLGPISAWIAGPNGDPNFIRLFHPGDGCSYALSYKDQKTAEYLMLENDKQVTGFHFTGHYHKMNFMRGGNGARFFLVPSSCGRTQFMKAKRLINQAGAYFVRFWLDKKGSVDRVEVEDIWLKPDQWRECDYSGFKKMRKRQEGLIIRPNVWASR